MIGRIYRLIDAKRIEMVQREVKFGANDVIVKPDYLSICAADQRYYFGQRDRETMNKKLPMALIHEATATVMYDASGKLLRGSKVVLVPLIEKVSTPDIKSNYVSENPFSSSGTDGFMCSMIAVPHCRLIPVVDNYSVEYVFSELISVVMNALDIFERVRIRCTDTIGVWGDGNMGFITSLTLKCMYPESKIYVFGKHLHKLQHFSFVDRIFTIDSLPTGLYTDHCFECVGGRNSDSAVQQIIDVIRPQGCVCLMGVSENPVPVRTRSILDKGLILIGNSRSNANDMAKAVELISKSDVCKKYLKMLISETVTVNNENDMIYAFEQSILNNFKTVMKWEV